MKKSQVELISQITAILRDLRGVRALGWLDDEDRERLGEQEEKDQGWGPFEIVNEGVRDCLRRRHLCCLIKDSTFRPPRCPTVLLVDADGVMIGREVLPFEKREEIRGERTVLLGRDFIIYGKKGAGREPRFLLPPVPFLELDGIEGVINVVSGSPSPQGDLYLKKKMGFPRNATLATVLVGFNISS